MGALGKRGKGSRRGDYVCLPWQYRSPPTASPFLWQSVPVQLILLPARAFKALKAQKLVGLLQGDTLRAVGRTIPFKGNRWALPRGPLENGVGGAWDRAAGSPSPPPQPCIHSSPSSSPSSPFPTNALLPCCFSGLWQGGRGIVPRYRPGEVGYGPNLPVSSLLHRILNAAFEMYNMNLHSSPCKLNHSGLFTPSRYLKVPEKPVNGVKGLVSAAMPPRTNETLLARRCFGWRGRRGEAVSWSLAADSTAVTSSLPEAAGRLQGPASVQQKRASLLLIPDWGFAHVQTRATHSSSSTAVPLSAPGLTPA
ncbi:uncharacterized protein ACIBXB_014413 [Morphnus guianensis]